MDSFDDDDGWLGYGTTESRDVELFAGIKSHVHILETKYLNMYDSNFLPRHFERGGVVVGVAVNTQRREPTMVGGLEIDQKHFNI